MVTPFFSTPIRNSQDLLGTNNVLSFQGQVIAPSLCHTVVLRGLSDLSILQNITLVYSINNCMPTRQGSQAATNILMAMTKTYTPEENPCEDSEPATLVKCLGIQWSGRSAGEGIGYPLPDSQASVVAKLVKNPPAMQETWVQSLGWDNPLEKGKAIRFSVLARRIPWTIQSMGSQRVGHD